MIFTLLIVCTVLQNYKNGKEHVLFELEAEPSLVSGLIIHCSSSLSLLLHAASTGKNPKR